MLAALPRVAQKSATWRLVGYEGGRTGGAGFPGSHLCDQVVGRGNDVACADNLMTRPVKNLASLLGRPGFSFIRQDFSTFMAVPGPVDSLFHLASPASPQDYLGDPIVTLRTGSRRTYGNPTDITVLELIGRRGTHNRPGVSLRTTGTQA